MNAEWTRVAAYIVCRDAHNRLLLTRFFSETHPNSGKWTMPGGGMEWSETPEQTAQRELYEETGLAATIGPVLGISSHWMTADESLWGGTGHHVRIVLDTAGVEGELRTEFEPGSTDAAQWFTLEEIETLPHVPIVDFVLDLL